MVHNESPKQKPHVLAGISPQIQFHGRWDVESSNRYFTTWTGSSMSFQTTSRSIMYGRNSAVKSALVRGKRTMTLFLSEAPESEGERVSDVIIMLCDNGGAKLQVLDIQTGDGQPFLPPRPLPSPNPLLFIGDSLISGYSPLNSGLVLPHGSYQSFGSIVVRTLREHDVDARLEMIAKPSTCLISEESIPGMEDIFWRGLLGQGGWEHRSTDIPKDIFICIGSDDIAHGSPVNAFLQHYERFLVRLRESYLHGLERIHVISPFGRFSDVSDPMARQPVWEHEVQQMVEALSQKWLEADPDSVKLYHIATEGWLHGGLTCDTIHPTVEGHEAIAVRLLKYMEGLEITGGPPGMKLNIKGLYCGPS